FFARLLGGRLRPWTAECGADVPGSVAMRLDGSPEGRARGKRSARSAACLARSFGCRDPRRPPTIAARSDEGRALMVDSFGWRLSTSAVVACVALAAVGGATARASGSSRVACSGGGGGTAGLVAAVNAANAGGGGVINLESGCTYSFTLANNTDPDLGASALPLITTSITINGGGGATIAGNKSNFRLIAISGPAGGGPTLHGINGTGGQGPALGPCRCG